MSEPTVRAAVAPERTGVLADPMDYDALCELETHLGGMLVARAQKAATPEEREMWRRRHDDQLLELQAIDPYDAVAIAALREDLAGRLRVLG